MKFYHYFKVTQQINRISSLVFSIKDEFQINQFLNKYKHPKLFKINYYLSEILT